MQFDFWTFGLQAANFLVLVWLLHRFLYRPVLAAIAARQAAADKLAHDSAQARAAVEAERQGLEAQKAALAQSRDEVLAQARTAAAAERKALLETARHDADALTADARKTLERERAEAAKTLGRDAAQLAGAIARRLVEGAADGAVQDRLIDRLCDDVDALATETKAQIVSRLQAPDGTVQVATATALTATRRKRLSDRLAKALGVAAPIKFRVEPGLIAGGEIRFPFTVLKRAWSDDLNRIQAELVRDDA